MNRTAWGRQWTQAKGPFCPSSLYTTSEETVLLGRAIAVLAKSSADLRSLPNYPLLPFPLISPSTSFYTQSLPWDVTSKGQATFKMSFPPCSCSPPPTPSLSSITHYFLNHITAYTLTSVVPLSVTLTSEQSQTGSMQLSPCTAPTPAQENTQTLLCDLASKFKTTSFKGATDVTQQSCHVSPVHFLALFRRISCLLFCPHSSFLRSWWLYFLLNLDTL